MDDYLELTFDIFDEAGQRAAVRPTLTAAELIDEILQEFEGLDRSTPAAYALSVGEGGVMLDPQRSLTEQGIRPGDRLVFGWAKKASASPRQPLSQPGRAVLQELTSGKIFPLTWQPARIGRPDSDATHNQLLVLNTESLPNGSRVSRAHAQITEREGVYMLESLSANNPTLLNGVKLAPGRPALLTPRDTIDLGQSGIRLRFLVKPV